MNNRRFQGAPTAGAARSLTRLARIWLRILAAAVGVAAILAISGAFGHGTDDVVSHVAYWLALAAAGVTTGVVIGAYVIPGSWFDRRPWMAGLTIALAIWPVMIVLNIVVAALADHAPITAATAFASAPSTLAITVAMTFLAFLVRPQRVVETHAGAVGAPPPKFVSRMPARLQGAILWAVEAEDHYLRLHTSLGQDLILMRLGDAVAELEGIEGARTHRSWWVARAAVTQVERENGRARLVLADGAEAPVSRPYVKSLRAAGWF